MLFIREMQLNKETFTVKNQHKQSTIKFSFLSTINRNELKEVF